MRLDYLMDCPPYVENSAGIRAMHYLAALLHRAGITCWTAFENPFEKLPVTHLAKTENLVAIYPDCVGPENPRAASRCVRFMCAPASWPRPGFFGGDKIPKDDLVLLFDGGYQKDIQDHYDAPLDPNCVFPIPCIERDLFYPEPKTIERTVYIGKSPTPEIVWANRIITRGSHTREEAAAILRQTKRFYTLDHYTMMAQEAALCGCEVFKMEPDGTAYDYPTDPDQYLMMPECDDWIAPHFDAMVKKHFSPARGAIGRA
jgi:hypothetical protein